jgi:hypothetical protein
LVIGLVWRCDKIEKPVANRLQDAILPHID